MGRRRVWLAWARLGFGAAVAIPIVVWIFWDLSTAANVAEVVSLPLAGASGLFGLAAALSDGGRLGENDPGPGEQPTPLFWNLVRRWATLQPIRQRMRSESSHRRVLRIMAIVAAIGLLTAGLVVWDRVAGNQPQANQPQAKLLVRVPEPLRGHCSKAASPADIHISATLSCQDASGQEVAIGLFDTESSMDDAYREIVRQATIPRGSGDCAILTGAEHRYPAIGAPVGRTLCYRQDGNAFLVWTNDAARTVAAARRVDGNDFELYRFWSSLVGVPPFPTPDEDKLRDISDESETDCHRAPAGSLDRFAGVVAAIECEAGDPGADTVSFYRFADPDALRRSYNAQVRDVNAKRGGPDCEGGEAPGFLVENSWNIRDVKLGRLLCYTGQQGELVMEWTLEPLLLLARAVGTDSKALGKWWTEYAGPSAEEIFTALNAQIGFPNPVEQALLDHVPPASQLLCTRPSEEVMSDDLISTPIAAIVCDTDGGPPEVYYYQFSDAAKMAANYGEISPGSDCRSIPSDFTGEAAYSKGTATGRLACSTGQSSGLPYLIWTHDQLNILAFAYRGDDPETLLSWWSDKAGPV